MTKQSQTILITGATSGFGEAMARLFAAEIPDIKLILTGRRAARLDALKAELNVPVHIWVQDITNINQIKSDVAELPDEFKNITCLVNNAGLALGADSFQNMNDGDIDKMIDVNIKGMVHMTREVLPGMIERGQGYVINLGSVAGNYIYPGGNIYAGTKAFVNHFSKALRADVKGRNIRVTSVEPGAVETEFSVVRFKGDKEKADSVYEGYRKLTADHIAKTILWLVNQPQEMNVNQIEIMPTDQSFAGFSFDKELA